MADYDKFDPRVDALVMESRTLWDPAVEPLSDDDKAWLAHAIHQKPAEASNVGYYRSHSGFTREIKVSVSDIERLYRERFAG